MPKTIDAFFRKEGADSNSEVSSSTSNLQISIPEQGPTKVQRIIPQEIDISTLERDLGLRSQIWEYPINQQDEIR